jgi:hypothetical protein
MCSSKYCHDSAYPNNVPPINPSTTVGSDMSELQLVRCWAIDESGGHMHGQEAVHAVLQTHLQMNLGARPS